MNKKIIIAVMLLIFVTACLPGMRAETGKEFDVNMFKKIKEKQTTKQYLVKTFGQPQQTGIKESGREMWTYLYLAGDSPSWCMCITPSLHVKHSFRRMTITFEGNKVFEKSYEVTKGKEEEKKD